MGFAFQIESVEHFAKANKTVLHGHLLNGLIRVGDNAVLSRDTSKTPLTIQGLVLGAGMAVRPTLAGHELLKDARNGDILSCV